MAWDYSSRLQELFANAVSDGNDNYLGEISDADGEGHFGSIACGDAIFFYFLVDKDDDDPRNDRITKVRYRAYGCTSAIASSEALCEIIEKGKLTPLEALKITSKDIADYMGGVPPQKMHCSVMGAEVIQAAVLDWSKKRGVDLVLKDIKRDHHEDDKVICNCFSLTENVIKEKIIEHSIPSLDGIEAITKAGSGCGSCKYNSGGLQDILLSIWGESEESDKAEEDFFDDLKLQVAKVIDEKINPMLNESGEAIELVEVKGPMIYCSVDSNNERVSDIVQITKEYLQKEFYTTLVVINV